MSSPGKSSGLGDNFYIDGIDVSNDLGALSRISAPQTVAEQTGIDRYAPERIALLRDGAMDGMCWWNPTGIHTKLDDLPTADVVLSYFRGTAVGNDAASMVAKQLNYDGTRANTGQLTFNFSAQANGYGLEWGEQLTAGIVSHAGATNGSSLDNGASTAFGLQAYLHVFGVTGTSVTAKLQHSTDNAVWADVTGGGFTAVLAGATSAQRIATANNLTINRYLRVVTTGTFNPATLACMVVRNPIANVNF